MKRKSFVFLLSIALAACQSNESNTPPGTPAAPASGPVTINGAGATFPTPIYSKWFDEYQKSHPEVRINYQSIGSGAGIRQLTAQTVFFGASDGPMLDAQLQSAPGAILHFPTVLGGVVPVYNLSDVAVPLRFTGTVLADIYLGKVTKWNDPAIAKINPGVKLPDVSIVVVHRSDGSGTNYIFCDFLSKVSLEFSNKVGLATSVDWPVGIGAKGSEGVSGLVRQTPGAIGYVELIYALQNKIPFGAVQNKNGQFITASLQSVTLAATGVKMPDDFRVSITNSDAVDAYPIASFTWLLVYEHPADKARGKAMADFVRWALKDGQKFAPSLGYAPLPQVVVEKEIQALSKIQ